MRNTYRIGKKVCYFLISGLTSCILFYGCNKQENDPIITPPTPLPLVKSAASLVFVGNEGRLCCFNAKNGELKWSKSFQSRVEMTPFYANGIVYAAANTNLILGGPIVGLRAVYALDTLGNIKWTRPLDCGAIEVNNGIVYSYGAYIVTALNPIDGSILWSFDYRTAPIPYSARSIGQKPVIYKGVIYANTGDAYIAIDAQTGVYKWKKAGVGNSSHRPRIVNDKAYLIDGDGYVTVLNTNTGNIIWQKRLITFSGTMNIVGDKLIIKAVSFSGSRFLYVYDTTSNPQLQWSKEYFNSSYSNSTQFTPVCDGKYIHVKIDNIGNFVDVVNINTGVSIGQYGVGYDPDLASVSDVTLVNGFSFYSTKSDKAFNDTLIGRVFCREINNNVIVPNSGWRSNIRGNYRYSPCVVTTDGKCYVGAEEY